MVIKGNAHKFANDINTDEVIAAKYLDTTDAKELGSHCMEVLDKDFSKKIKRGDIIVAGKNFGCGSSREHAPLAIKGCGISCVIAGTFARIFYRNAINIGLPILESEEAAQDINEGNELEIDLGLGRIKNLTSGKIYQAPPFPSFMQELIKAGGLMAWLKKT